MTLPVAIYADTIAKEIDEMLSDCSAEEANRLIRVLQEFKGALHKEQQG